MSVFIVVCELQNYSNNNFSVMVTTGYEQSRFIFIISGTLPSFASCLRENIFCTCEISN